MKCRARRSTFAPSTAEEGLVSTTEQPVEIDGDKLMQFVFRAVDEAGAFEARA
jgi:hypothetical protein